MSPTGGIANVTIDVDYPQTGDHVVLQQDFTGLGVFNHLGVSTRLSGAVPAITLGSSIEMDDYINTVVSIGLGAAAGGRLGLPFYLAARFCLRA